MVRREAWVDLFGADPRPWLRESDEPAARWITFTQLLDRPAGDPEVKAAHAAVLADPATRAIVDRLPRWDEDAGASGHDSPAYAPNLLHLLADMGVRGGDLPAVEGMLDEMCGHQTADGRFLAFGRTRGAAPAWGTLLCDTHAVAEVLVRYGREKDPATRRALERMAADLAATPQGPAWTCLPDPATGFRGPGRKGDVCPQVTVEALRTFARLSRTRRPPEIAETARAVLGLWRSRGREQPYLFGHGRRFKTVKWPPFWYGVLWVLDALAGYPEVWNGEGDDRRATAELVACLVAYNIGPDGRVTPRSCYRGFEAHSFGQKRRPSPFATARIAALVRRFEPIAAEVAGIDPARLSSSRGGTGTPAPPPGGWPERAGDRPG